MSNTGKATISELAADLAEICARFASGDGGEQPRSFLTEKCNTLTAALAALPAQNASSLAAKTRATAVLINTAGADAAEELCRSLLADLDAFLAAWERQGEE